jgi:hypothetical protein
MQLCRKKYMRKDMLVFEGTGQELCLSIKGKRINSTRTKRRKGVRHSCRVALTKVLGATHKHSRKITKWLRLELQNVPA